MLYGLSWYNVGYIIVELYFVYIESFNGHVRIWVVSEWYGGRSYPSDTEDPEFI